MRVPFLGGIDLETHEGEALDLGPSEVDSGGSFGVDLDTLWGVILGTLKSEGSIFSRGVPEMSLSGFPLSQLIIGYPKFFRS